MPLAMWLASAALTGTTPSPAPVLPFVEDDYDKALSLARAKGIPIFAEAWAPW